VTQFGVRHPVEQRRQDTDPRSGTQLGASCDPADGRRALRGKLRARHHDGDLSASPLADRQRQVFKTGEWPREDEGRVVLAEVPRCVRTHGIRTDQTQTDGVVGEEARSAGTVV